jgi:hypothetical protein
MEGDRILKNQRPLYCPIDHRRLGNVPAPMLWTGVVAHIPEDPEDLAGLTYLPCEDCRRSRRPQWHRYETIPPDPIIKIVVPVILADERRSA